MKPRFALVALLFCLSAPAQQPTTPLSAAIDQASVEFNFEWNQGLPWQSYSIQVQADGKTHFAGTPNPSQDGDSDPVQQDFIMSEANRQKTFDSCQEAELLSRETSIRTSSTLRKPAARRWCTSQLRSRVRAPTTTRRIADVQQLTQLFLGLATTLDYGRKLAFQYRFDKLGMDQLLREFEEQQASHQVEELSAIEPILRKIANDSNLMHITRQSAQHLLKTIDVPGAASQSSVRP